VDPSDLQWLAVLELARKEPVRNRVMLALAYDAALRREELCSLGTDDLDPAHRTLRVRAETTKNRRERVVPYSATTGVLLSEYLRHRVAVSRARGPLFLSESRRNRGQPLTLWTWSKVIHKIAVAADLPRFSTHTTRHLCLTDLARTGWELRRPVLPLATARDRLEVPEENDFARRSAADAVALVLHGCAARRTSFWAWAAAAWAEVLGPSRKVFQGRYPGWADSSARTYAIGLALPVRIHRAEPARQRRPRCRGEEGLRQRPCQRRRRPGHLGPARLGAPWWLWRNRCCETDDVGRTPGTWID
jgi:hypothetical protein